MTSPYPDAVAVDQVGLGFSDRTLPKPEWTHAAHFAATVWMLRRRPEIDLPTAMPGMIRAYNEACGVANDDHGGYHETITQASIRACRAFLASRPADEALDVTLTALIASPLGDKTWLLTYWARETLFSVDARRRWMAPDLAPLPF